MGWSFRLFRIAGIDIRVHFTFFLIVLFGAFQGSDTDGAAGAAFGVLLILLLFVCVTLHELGHSVVAQHFGVPVREIILLPIGGVALMSRTPSRPLHEFLIAAAGPLVNVVITALLITIGGIGVLTGTLDPTVLTPSMMTTTLSIESLLSWLLQANIALVLFNLIPAFPLDGGRILRALLAMLMSPQRATRISTLIGQGLALLMLGVGVLTSNILLIVIAAFIFFGSGQEQAQGRTSQVLQRVRVGDIYNRYALTLQSGDRVEKVVQYILTSYQPDFAVLHGEQLVGIVTRDDVLRALSQGGGQLFVSEIMRRDIVRVDVEQRLDTVRDLMTERGARIVAVYQGDRYLGLVSINDIAEGFSLIAYQPPTTKEAIPPPDRPVDPIVVEPIAAETVVPESTQSAEPPSARQQLENTLVAKRRRLGALEIQQRYFGSQTPSHIVAEIKALQQTIHELESSLAQLTEA